MNDRQTKEFDSTKECNFAIAPPGIGRFRVSAFVQQGFTGAVLRTINAKIPTLEELELPPVLKEVVLSKRGFVILVGGTGSGKSTSLAAMVGYRNEKTRGHIVTIEDPVEYVHAHKGCVVTHREVGVDCESWHLALKNTLRQAPDVILIGEIRDRETMEYGIQFAETGHLVLATLHANSSNQALDRIINFFPEERREQLLMDLSLNIRALISQRLIPREAGSGRIAAMEIMLASPLISDLIFKGEVAKIKDVMARSNRLGMKTFDQALFDLYEAGLISYEDALRNADSKNELRLRVKLESKREMKNPEEGGSRRCRSSRKKKARCSRCPISAAAPAQVMNTKPLFKLMVERKASDLFFTCNAPVKIKIEGKIFPVNKQVLSPETVRQAALGLMTAEQIEHFNEELEIDFAISEPGLGRFRVNVFYQRGYPAMVLRYITAEMPKLEDLGMPEILKDLVMLKRGLILMVGAAGAGKSTTLAAMINYRNETSSDHILTIEDPIEFLHTNKKSIVNQREVGLDTKSFARALRSAVRSAPDVILVGEIRDRETMEAAIALAGTGHLCIATLHANNCAETLDRIINMFPRDQHNQIFLDLSQYLRAILSQRLVAAKSGMRVAASEVMVNTPHVSELIKKGDVIGRQGSDPHRHRTRHAELRQLAVQPGARGQDRAGGSAGERRFAHQPRGEDQLRLRQC